LNEDDPKGLLKGLFGGWNRTRENALADIGLGFVPIAGTAADVQDAKRAIENRDLVGLGLAGVGFVPGVGDVVKGVGKGLRRALGDLPAPRLNRQNWEGRRGNMNHLTAKEEGYVPTEYIADLQGARGEIRGQHRNRQGQKWEDFKSDIAQRGIQNPIFIVNEPGFGPRIYEGNHRLDAALELGLSEVPVEIKHFGKEEELGYIEDLFRARNKLDRE